MNIKKMIISFLCPLLLFGGCASDSVSDEPYSDITEEITEFLEDTEITSIETSEQLSDHDITEEVTEPIRDIKFNSMEEAEQISDSDLIYIAQQDGNAAYTDIEEFDLFGVELLDDPDSEYPLDSFHLKTIKSAEEIDILSYIDSEEIKRIADKENRDFVEKQRSQKPGDETGDIPEDVEYIFCGENDWYIEYSIRFTDVRTMYSGSSLVTFRIPRAYRFIYMKTMSNGFLMGELSAEYVQQQLDLLIWTQHSNICGEHILYREVTETEDAYVYSYLYTSCSSADWNVNATAYLQTETWTVDKQTHGLNCSPIGTIKEVEIEGTALYLD